MENPNYSPVAAFVLFLIKAAFFAIPFIFCAYLASHHQWHEIVATFSAALSVIFYVFLSAVVISLLVVLTASLRLAQ